MEVIHEEVPQRLLLLQGGGSLVDWEVALGELMGWKWRIR